MSSTWFEFWPGWHPRRVDTTAKSRRRTRIYEDTHPSTDTKLLINLATKEISMSRLLSRHALLAALMSVAIVVPAIAEDAHHPPTDPARPPAMQPGQPVQPQMMQPSMPGPGGMMMGNMMQMMHQMMSMTMPDRDAMHRMGMMSMTGMGMMRQMPGQMAGRTIEHVEGHIAFVKAELNVTASQSKVWDEFAATMRANAKQLNELAAELAKAPAATSPVDRIERQEKTLAVRLEAVRRTKPALSALYAALSEAQKKIFAQLSTHPMSAR